MTCRPSKYPNLDDLNPTFKTHCYRCGRPMLFVKVVRKETGEVEPISDDQWSQDEFFHNFMNVERTYEVSEEMEQHMQDFINGELKEWMENRKKVVTEVG